MRLDLLGAFASIVLVACGGARPSTAATPVPGPEPAASAPTPSAPLRYHPRGAVTYVIQRYDTLLYASMPGAPQATAKRAIVTIRPLPGRSNELEVRLDSLQGLEESVLRRSTVDSSIGSRWQLTLTPSGPRGGVTGGAGTVVTGQIGEIVRLLFPQLPEDGLRVLRTWTDSTRYSVRVDAFDAAESALRTSQAGTATAAVGQSGLSIPVEAEERLARTGTAMQAGQTMMLRGAGARRMRYEFLPDGWVGSLSARDSLELVVTVGTGGETVPVRWRSTLIGRLRDLPLR
ncbi:MAG TPA: hypothetical protein VFU23_10575 [Gemmatimonadales bacterium]|nr:hypothetical protein [Gemmatimonadales bacterium]